MEEIGPGQAGQPAAPQFVARTCSREAIEEQLGANMRNAQVARAVVQAATILLQAIPQGGAIQFSVKSGKIIALAGAAPTGAADDFLFVCRVPVLAGVTLST